MPNFLKGKKLASKAKLGHHKMRQWMKASESSCCRHNGSVMSESNSSIFAPPSKVLS